jgi:hypothetical protein
MSAEIRDKINLKILNLNHRFLFMVGRAFLTIGAVVALSNTNANAANVLGYACVQKTMPTKCDHSYFSHPNWYVYQCSGGSEVTKFSGDAACSNSIPVDYQDLEALEDHNRSATPKDIYPSPYFTYGQYCWCKLNIVENTAVNGLWVYRGKIAELEAGATEATCQYSCPSLCGTYAQTNATFRTKLFSTIH